MTVFVTGATGFIGGTLVRRLAARGHRVLCLVRRPERAAWLGEVAGAVAVRGELADAAALEAPVREAHVVIHLAGRTTALHRREYLAVNGQGTGRLAGTVRRVGRRVRRLVYVSSLAVAGPRSASDPAREEDPAAPITPYGESKLLGETLLREQGPGPPWTVLRPPVVYGPRDRALLPCFRAAARGLAPLLRRGTLELSMAHVDDVAEAILLAAFSEAAEGRVYYLSDGAPHTSADLARRLLDLAGGGRLLPVPDAALALAGLCGDLAAAVTRRPALLNGHKVHEIRQPGWVCSIDRIRAELGYEPRVSLEAGLASTYRWYRANGWL